VHDGSGGRDVAASPRPTSAARVANSREHRVIGRTVSHYRILSELGSGGMGVVFRAEDRAPHRPFA